MFIDKFKVARWKAYKKHQQKADSKMNNMHNDK